MCKYDFVLAGQCVELILCGYKVFSGQFRNSLCHFYVKALRRIQASADCGAAQSQCLQIRQCRYQHFTVAFQRRTPAADFLGKLNRCCVLQVGTAALYNALVLFFQTAEGCNQCINCRQNLILYCKNSGNVHCGRKCVIGRLAHVDIIVRMQKLCSGDFISAVCNYLIGIHVRLRAASGLPYNQRKMFIQTTGNHFITSTGNCSQLFICHFFRTQLMIGHCSSFFQNSECMCNLSRHGFDSYADQKVFMAALCLRCPILIRRNLYLAHRVMLNAILHVHLSYFVYFVLYILKGAVLP